MQTLLGKLTYANVVATLALFLALGGGAVWAAGQLGKNVVKSKNIAADAVQTKDIARNAVKSGKINASPSSGSMSTTNRSRALRSVLTRPPRHRSR